MLSYITTILLLLLFLFQTSHPFPYQPVDIPKAKSYIEAFLRDLEVLSDPPNGTVSPSDPSEFPKIQAKFLNDLLAEVTASQESLEKLETISIFNRMVDLYSKINLAEKTLPPALSLPKALSHGSPCNPLHHFTIPVTEDIIKDSFEPEDFYPQLQQWLNKITSSPDLAVCDTHLGLICPPSTDSSASSTCTCQPKTKWISPPGKCFLSPDFPCTFLNLHLQTAHFTRLHDPSWFLTRVLTFPVASPTCGDGLVCDSVRDRHSSSPTCLCTHNSSRNGECLTKSTWAESESLAHKISKLIIEVGQPCSPPKNPEIDGILKSLTEKSTISLEKAEELKNQLVQNGEPLCDYENFEWCSKDHKICLRNCPLPGQTHDPSDSFKCKFNYGQKCTTTTGGRDGDQCIRQATCTKLNWSKGIYQLPH